MIDNNNSNSQKYSFRENNRLTQSSPKYEIVKKYFHAPAEAVEGLDYFDTWHEANNFLYKYFNNGEYMTDEFGRHRYYIVQLSETRIFERERALCNLIFGSYITD